jgi:hypothetical protein
LILRQSKPSFKLAVKGVARFLQRAEEVVIGRSVIYFLATRDGISETSALKSGCRNYC